MTSDNTESPLASVGQRMGYHALVASAPLARTALGASVWERCWSRFERRAAGVAQISLHGQSVVVNVGHPYPAFIRRWPTYNGPLVALVRATSVALERRVTVVDVGASIGDTALLLRDHCPDHVGAIWCIEGDDFFAALLRTNLGGMTDVHVVHALAGDGADSIPELVRTHAGSASPRGDNAVPASTLDELVAAARNIDVVKVDTDGYDGRVLDGARRTLTKDRPAVQFEWHPALAEKARVPHRLAFSVLLECGYDTFLWFDKFGRYVRTELEFVLDNEALREHARWCIRGSTPAPDWHYDVIALPTGTSIDRDALEGFGG